MRCLPAAIIAIGICSACLLSLAPLRAQAPARDTPAPRPASAATIRGRVLASESGRPLGKAQVRITSTAIPEGRTARTDAEGRYEFKDLPAGRYQLTASKAGFVQLQHGQLRPFESGKPIDVRDGDVIEKVEFSLPRGAVIAGRVLDELGEPAVEVSVAALRYQYVKGRRRLLPAGRSAVTNDIGEFRLYGLMPGSYYVSVMPRESILDTVLSGAALTIGDTASGYAPTYYPGTERVTDARRVTVTVGQTVSEIQIPLSLTRTARVSGFARDSDGRALTQGVVMAMSMDMPANPFAARLQPDGGFSISGLSPGEYVILTTSGNPLAGNAEIATVTVTVAGDDLSGVQLHASKPVTVAGKILPAPTPARPVPVSELTVMTVAANPDIAIVGSPTPARINADHTFEMKALPGRVLFRLGGSTGTWEIRAVRLRGDDITDTGLEFKPNEDVSDLEIELTDQPTALTGVVTESGGKPSRDFVVVAFPQDAERWTPTSRGIAVSRPDQEGRFRARVPGGSYYVAALDYLEPGEELDPDFLARLRDAAVKFSINSGELKTMDLKMIRHP